MEYFSTDTGLLITVWPKDSNRFDCFHYHSWNSFFFGDEVSYHFGGLCCPHKSIFLSPPTFPGWSRIQQRIIAASCLAELELQLSVRGF